MKYATKAPIPITVAPLSQSPDEKRVLMNIQ